MAFAVGRALNARVNRYRGRYSIDPSATLLALQEQLHRLSIPLFADACSSGAVKQPARVTTGCAVRVALSQVRLLQGICLDS